MKSFFALREEADQLLEESAIKQATDRLKKVKKGSQVSFDHHKHGTVTGKFGGLKRMGGRTYADIHTDKETHRVPVHHVKEAVELEERRDDGTRVVKGGYRDKDGRYHPPKTRDDLRRDAAAEKAAIHAKTRAALKD